jgi:hypothetical protein
MVPSRPSFLEQWCFGTRCEGAYSTMTLNCVPGKEIIEFVVIMQVKRKCPMKNDDELPFSLTKTCPLKKSANSITSSGFLKSM